MSDLLQSLPSGVPLLSTSLDPPETYLADEPLAPAVRQEIQVCGLPRHPYLDTGPVYTFRHSGWAADRVRVARALLDADVPQHRLDAFAYCGQFASVVKSNDEPPRYRVVGSCCHDRFCVPCARERARRISSNVIAALGGRVARFLTLTIASADLSLTESVDKLIDSFRRLRQRPLWRERVDGGAAFLEVTRNQETGRWHPHYHCLIEGRYLPQARIAAEWLEITGDSYIVDIRLVRNEATAARYVAKYVAKPTDVLAANDPDGLVLAIRALAGRRMCQTFGTWRGYKLCVTAELVDWTTLGPLDEWLQRARDGDAEAAAILRAANPHTADLAIAECSARPPPTTRPPGRSGPRQTRLFPAW